MKFAKRFALGICLAFQIANAATTEVLAPLYIEGEFQQDVFIYLEEEIKKPESALTPRPPLLFIEAEKTLNSLALWMGPQLEILRSKVVDAHGHRLLPFAGFTEAGLDIKFNEDQVEAHISVPPALRRERVHQLRGLGLPVQQRTNSDPEPFSFYLNSYASQSYETNDPSTPGGLAPLNASFNSAANINNYVLESSATYNALPGTSSTTLHRTETRLVKDLPDRLLRTSAGDLNYPTSYFQQFHSMGGFSVTKEFRLQPYKIVVPSGSRTFFLKSPSVVTVIRNGERLQSINLPAGTHSLNELPVSPGINKITIEIRDDSGRLEYIEIPLSITSESLAKGIHQFTYNLGHESAVSDQELKYESTRSVGSMFHRYGISDHFTIGASGQANKDQAIAGFELLFSTGIGSFQLDAAHSELHTGSYGEAARLLYNYVDNTAENKAYRSFQASVEWNALRFGLLGDTTPERIAEYIYMLSYSQQFSESISGSVTLNHEVNRALNANYINSNRIDLTLTKNFLSGLNTNLTFSQAKTNLGFNETSAHFLLTYSFPSSNHSASTRAESDHTATGDRQLYRAEWRYRKGSRADRLELQAGLEDQLSTSNADLQMNYTGNRGLLGAAHYVYAEKAGNLRQSTRLNVGSGLAYTKGRWAWGQPVGDGFAIVTRPPHWKDQAFGVNPGFEDSYDAQVDNWGPALFTGLNAYQYDQVSFDNSQLQAGYQFEPSSYVLLPTYKSGFLLTPGTEASVVIVAKLASEIGQPVSLAIGQIDRIGKTQENSIEFFTTAEGAVMIEGLKSGKYQMRLQGMKPIEIEIPSDKTGVIDLGTLKAIER